MQSIMPWLAGETVFQSWALRAASCHPMHAITRTCLLASAAVV